MLKSLKLSIKRYLKQERWIRNIYYGWMGETRCVLEASLYGANMTGGGWKAVLGSSFERAEEEVGVGGTVSSHNLDCSPMYSRRWFVALLGAVSTRDKARVNFL